MMTPAELEQHDKHRSAIHEAGHLTVALANGVRVRAWLYKSHTSDPMNEWTWLGKCSLIGGPMTEAIGVAGAVADCWERDSDVSPHEAIEYIESEELSPTDRAASPQTSKGLYTAVIDSLTVLRKHKAFFDWVVERLVEDELITDGEAWDRFHGIRYD